MSSELTLTEVLEAFRKTGSKYKAAQNLEISLQSKKFSNKWDEALEKDLIEDVSSKHGQPVYTLTPRGIHLLADLHEADISDIKD